MKFSRLKSVCFQICLLALLRPLAIGQASGPIQEQVIPAGTEIQLTLQDPVSSKLSEAGDEVIATVRRDVIVEGRTLLQRGTEIVGRVTLAEQAKRPFKGGRLHLTFERVRFSGHEQKITALIKSASDFTRDEKIKTNSEGTLDGGKDGGKVLQNVMTGAGIGGIGMTIAILASVRNDNAGFGGYGGIGRGGAIAGAAVLGGGAVVGLLMTKGKEVKLDQSAIIRVRLERPLSVE